MTKFILGYPKKKGIETPAELILRKDRKLSTHANVTSSRYCSKTEGNIPADSPGNSTETVSLVNLWFVYVVLLTFDNILV